MLSKKFANLLRGQTGNPFDRFAEAVKDFLLDLEEPDPPPAVTDLPEELPPLVPGEFVQALRPRMEQIMFGIAAAINAASAGDVVSASEAQVSELLAALWSDAVALGVRMRLEAAERATALPPPASAWAAKYRQMRAAGAILPAAPNDARKTE